MALFSPHSPLAEAEVADTEVADTEVAHTKVADLERSVRRGADIPVKIFH